MASRLTFVLLLAMFVLVSCGGTTDAGSAASPGANPNCAHELNHTPNTWLLTNANIRFVFWGKYWSTSNNFAYQFDVSGLEENVYQATWQQLIHNGVFDRLAEYGIQGAVLDSYNYNTNQFDSTTTSIDDSTISTELNSEITAGQLPVPNEQTVFVVFLPPQVTTPRMVAKSFAGYHASTSYGHIKYAFAMIEYFPFDQNIKEFLIINANVSHELYEAFTDPDVSTGYSDGGNEVGDLCEGQYEMIDGIALVQKVWSNGRCSCL